MSGILQKGARRFTTQIGAAGVPDAVTTTIPLVSVTGLPTDTPIELVIDRTDASGNLTPAKEEVVRGTVSGTSLINCIRGVEGTAQAHSAGATVNSFLTASMWNNIIEYTRDLPTRGLINGLIVPTVAGNNLTVAIKTLQNTDPSPANPVYVWINNTLRSITSALSGTINAGTNYHNLGSAELATKETDLFVYAGWNAATNNVMLITSRIPYARRVSDFVLSSTNEKGWIVYANETSSALTDNVVNIGRFAATLSASPSHNWSVPTFTNANLIQEPIYETRYLDWTPAYTGGGSMTYTSVTLSHAKYQITNQSITISFRTSNGTTGGSAGQFIDVSLPFDLAGSLYRHPCYTFDGSGNRIGWGDMVTRAIRMYKFEVVNFGLGVQRELAFEGNIRLT